MHRRSTLLALILAATAASCAHHLRLENSREREEPIGSEIISDVGDLIVVLGATREDLVITLEREVLVEQDIDVQTVADEVVLPWSGRALGQFLLVSWNPVLWCFPDLWREETGRDHAAFRDWVLLWNPFLRTGGEGEQVRGEVVLRHRVERRQLGAHRIPVNQTEAGLEITAGNEQESVLRTTDNHGQVRLAWSVLPEAMRHTRPITAVVRIEGREPERAQLF